MISSFEIANFKAFGEEPQTIPLKPLTIIFGPNSSGKSSILHSLLFAHHAVTEGELDVISPSLGGSGVDLGGFLQMLHRGHEEENAPLMTWACALSASVVAHNLDAAQSALHARLGGGAASTWSTLLKGVENIRIELRFGRCLPVKDQREKQKALPFVTRGVSIWLDSELLLEASMGSDNQMKVDQLALDASFLRYIVRTYYDVAVLSARSSDDALEPIIAEINDAVADMRLELDGILPSVVHLKAIADSADIQTDKRPNASKFLARKLSEFIAGLNQCVKQEFLSAAYLGPLRTLPPRHLAFRNKDELADEASGSQAWVNLLNDGDLRGKVNEWLSDEKRLGTPYVLEVEEYIDRTAANRLLPDQVWDAAKCMFQHFLMQDEQYSEEFIDAQAENDYAGDPESDWDGWNLPKLDAWHKSLKESYLWEETLSHISNESFPRPEAIASDLVLLDKRTNTRVSHRDVGIGISQSLPVLALAMGSKEKLIAIEQPELHLHPRLQAELGDVFIDSAKGGTANRFLLETHSEHLILRILRRIRESSRAENPTLRPEDVCVLYVHPKESGSVIMRMRISEDGQFLDPWPGGFFPERMKEMMGA